MFVSDFCSCEVIFLCCLRSYSARNTSALFKCAWSHFKSDQASCVKYPNQSYFLAGQKLQGAIFTFYRIKMNIFLCIMTKLLSILGMGLTPTAHIFCTLATLIRTQIILRIQSDFSRRGLCIPGKCIPT